MTKVTVGDPFLEERLARYDRWLDDGQISYSAKVIPVTESLDAKQWVVPTEQAMAILRGADSVAVQNCECRTHYGRCNHPLEVCLLLNQAGDEAVSKDEARHVSLDEAEEILTQANESGLVHLSLYMPDHQVYALCSCCSCCCHDLQIIKLFGRPDLMVRSEYVAVTDGELCIDCGACIEQCIFDARVELNGHLAYAREACVGCGLCVTACPVEATSMAEREREAR